MPLRIMIMSFQQGASLVTLHKVREIELRRKAVIDELSELDAGAMTPLEALTKLFELRERAKDGN